MARADGSYKDGGTIGILKRNLYGNPSGTYYHIEGLMNFLATVKAKLNEAESCLVKIEMKSGTIVAAIAIEYFLVTAETIT